MTPAVHDRRPPRRGTGSQHALRAANRSRLLRALRDRGPSTQAELARATGLSAATVSNLVRVLVDEQAVSTDPTTSSGRRAVLVRLEEERGARVAVGIDIGRSHLRIVASTPGRRLLAEAVRELPVGHVPRDTIEAVARLLAETLDGAGLDASAVVGCGVGVPGPLDTRTGEIAHSSYLPEWAGLKLAERIEERLGLPTHVENDANLGALGEISWGERGDVENLVYVKVGSGIGAGLVLGGRLHRGHIGVTGEIGHTNVTDRGVVCRCGRHGCLETVASTRAMLAMLRAARRGPEPGVDDLVAAALAGEPATLRIVEDAGLALGGVLGTIANLLNPEVIVLGGSLTPLGDLLGDPVRTGLARWSTPVISSSTPVVMSALEGRSEVLGGCSHVIRHADALPL